jgi:hypothetical protein
VVFLGGLLSLTHHVDISITLGVRLRWQLVDWIY